MTTPARAEIRVEPDSLDPTRHKIVLSGEIEVGTLVDFSQALADPRIRGTQSRYVELESNGGSLTSAMAIGELVREGGFDTGVVEKGKCYSACVLILAAGVRRTVATGKIGVHRPYLDRGLHTPGALPPMDASLSDGGYSRAATDGVKHYLDKMGMRDGLMDAMMKVPSKFLRHLTSREVAVYGLDNTVPCKIVEVVPASDPVSEPEVARRIVTKKATSSKTAFRKKKTNLAKRNLAKPTARQVMKVSGPWGRVAAVQAAKRVKREYFASRS